MKLPGDAAMKALIRYERQITDAWLSEGVALKAIRENQLYEARGYRSFAEYYTQHYGYDKSTVSRRIGAAEACLNTQLDKEVAQPSQSVYRVLATVASDQQQKTLNRALEISISTGQSRVQVKHVRQAIQEHSGGFSDMVKAAGSKYGFLSDFEKMEIAQRWYERGRDDFNSKFYALYHSGVIDPADDGEPVEFAVAPIADIASVEKRWQRSLIASDNPNPPIEGVVNHATLVIDGQNIAQHWKGKRIRLNVKVLDDE